MTDFGNPHGTRFLFPFAAAPNLPVAAFAGVRKRRMAAFCIDFVLVSLAATASWIALVTVSLGLFLLFIPPLWPIVAFFYNGLTVAGPRMATPGMRVFDLEMRALDGGAVSFVAAACHGVMLYLSWLFPPVFLASLLTDDKRCLHDVFAGVIIVRRPFD